MAIEWRLFCLPLLLTLLCDSIYQISISFLQNIKTYPVSRPQNKEPGRKGPNQAPIRNPRNLYLGHFELSCCLFLLKTTFTQRNDHFRVASERISDSKRNKPNPWKISKRRWREYEKLRWIDWIVGSSNPTRKRRLHKRRGLYLKEPCSDFNLGLVQWRPYSSLGMEVISGARSRRGRGRKTQDAPQVKESRGATRPSRWNNLYHPKSNFRNLLEQRNRKIAKEPDPGA